MTVKEDPRSNVYDRQYTVGIQTLKVAGFDIVINLVNFSIYEDIFSHFTTIELTFLDAMGLNEDPGIFGGEEIEVEFESNPQFASYSKKFKVYKITDMQNSDGGAKHKMYTVHGITEPAFTNVEKRMSRAYKQKTEDKIVNDICKNVLGIKEIKTEEAKFDKNFVVPNLRPVTVIQEMCRSAIRKKKYPTANFIFYEDREKFHFRTVDDLVEQPKKWEVTHGVAGQTGNDQYARLNAKSFQNMKTFDFFKNVDVGMYGTRFFYMDLHSKNYDKIDYIYSSEFEDQEKIDGMNDPLMNEPPSFPEQKILFGAREKAPERDFSSHFSDEYMHKRKAIMAQFDNNMYILDVDGDTDLVLGDKVEFKLPSFDSTKDVDGGYQEEDDKKYSGMYIVSQIRHIVNNTEHRMILGLMKHQLKAE